MSATIRAKLNEIYLQLIEGEKRLQRTRPLAHHYRAMQKLSHWRRALDSVSEEK